jgi:hypothetical protein
MKLPIPPTAYDSGDQARTRGQIEQADAQNLKRLTAYDLILMRNAAGVVGEVRVNAAGQVIWSALP